MPKGVKMNNMKKKVLIASFFVALILLVPFTCLAESNNFKKIKVKQESEQSLQIRSYGYRESNLLDMLYMIGEYDLKYLGEYISDLIENGENLENTELLQEKISCLFANEESYLMETNTEDFISSSVDTGYDEQSHPMDLTQTGYTQRLTSSGQTYKTNSLKIEAINEELHHIETYDYGDMLVYVAGDEFDTNDTDELLRERLGWIGKTLDLREIKVQLKEEFINSFWPNITWIDAIETISSELFNAPVNVTDFIFNDLNQSLIDLAYQLFGGTVNLLNLILVYGIPYILERMYLMLNTTVGEFMRNQFDNIKTNFAQFIGSLFGFRLRHPFKTLRVVFKAFRNVLFTIFSFYAGTGLAIVYYLCDPTGFPEYVDGIIESGIKWLNAWYNYGSYVLSEPWTNPIKINGCVTGLDPSQLGNLSVYCKKDPSNNVTTNESGFFEGLYFNTTDEEHPWFLHKCVTTAKDETSSIIKTVGDSGDELFNLIKDLMETAAFSDGNLTLTIDFSEENNNVVYVQSQTSEVTIQGQVTTEIKTQEKSQYQLTVIRELIKSLVTNK